MHDDYSAALEWLNHRIVEADAQPWNRGVGTVVPNSELSILRTIRDVVESFIADEENPMVCKACGGSGLVTAEEANLV